MVADIKNCRVLFVSRAKQIVREIGHAGACGHSPPQGLSSPNGATPLPDGGVLVTEIGGWVDRLSKAGKLLWTIRTPTNYPSDAQLLPNGNVLVAGFNTPGRVDEITPAGKVVWTFAPSGHWSLDRPSLAVRWPNGNVAITDDWHHRVLVVHQTTKQVVWSYGHLNSPGSSPGYLRSRTASTCCRRARRRGRRRRRAGPPGGTPRAARRIAAPAAREPRRSRSPAGGCSCSAARAGGVLHRPRPARPARPSARRGPPSGRRSRRRGGAPPRPGAPVRRRAERLGRHHRARRPGHRHSPSAGRLDEPLSDLGAAVVGGRAYLVGGYTGSRFASAVLRYDGPGRTTTVARLPEGLRYAGVAALGSRIVVAGGVTTSGDGRRGLRRRSSRRHGHPDRDAAAAPRARRPRRLPRRALPRRRQRRPRARRSRPCSGSTRGRARRPSPRTCRPARGSRRGRLPRPDRRRRRRGQRRRLRAQPAVTSVGRAPLCLRYNPPPWLESASNSWSASGRASARPRPAACAARG